MSKRAQMMAGAAVLVLVAVLGVFLLPRQVHVERSTEIAAPPGQVYVHVADLSKNEVWSPWKAADPTMVMTLGSRIKGVGASYTWTGEESGAGKLTVAVDQPGVRIENELDFEGQGPARGTWTFEPAGAGTRVTWAVDMEAPGAMGGLFALMADGMIGPSFEDGLERLKGVVEGK